MWACLVTQSVVKNLPAGGPGLILGGDHLKKEMATHYSILAWEIL